MGTIASTAALSDQLRLSPQLGIAAVPTTMLPVSTAALETETSSPALNVDRVEISSSGLTANVSSTPGASASVGSNGAVTNNSDATTANVSIGGASTRADLGAAQTAAGTTTDAEAGVAGAVANDEADESEATNSANRTGEQAQNEAGLRPNGEEFTPEEAEELRRLAERDAAVRAHERAHTSVGGQYIRGGPAYQFEVGPDGQRYAVAGEVQIDVSEVPDDPQATIKKMQQVRRAALAPADPSAQDRQIAAEAARIEAEARAELARSRETEAGGAENETAVVGSSRVATAAPSNLASDGEGGDTAEAGVASAFGGPFDLFGGSIRPLRPSGSVLDVVA